MVQPNNNNRIDPKDIQSRISGGKFQTINPSGYATAASAAAAMAPFAGEAAAQSTGNVNAASVLHAAFTALPEAFGGGSAGMYSGMDELGVMGSSRYNTVNPGAGVGGAGDPGGLGTSQAALIDKMNSNNLQLLGLQSTLQNNMQSWTTKSNVLKSSYEAKMNMINKFSVRG